ncbi:hypothetical protein K505DRAFT_127368 [Melanomma pulvis-pyrius CBS 109.77]|uniref:Uncharacterized protein n=1 Tax=Melanomma pulvis-pyrius CBS 109.77 TaxID=1314802 RepID=A0A6A6WU61_9PLEO|nr:hypothetical protein K505DRAFT_127368 [Melanomma pulvis-pyrius CBS 109.77]
MQRQEIVASTMLHQVQSPCEGRIRTPTREDIRSRPSSQGLLRLATLHDLSIPPTETGSRPTVEDRFLPDEGLLRIRLLAVKSCVAVSPRPASVDAQSRRTITVSRPRSWGHWRVGRLEMRRTSLASGQPLRARLSAVWVGGSWIRHTTGERTERWTRTSGATDGEASAGGGRSGPLAEWIRFLGLSDPGGSSRERAGVQAYEAIRPVAWVQSGWAMVDGWSHDARCPHAASMNDSSGLVRGEKERRHGLW